jgi:hypothetical protein
LIYVWLFHQRLIIKYLYIGWFNHLSMQIDMFNDDMELK